MKTIVATVFLAVFLGFIGCGGEQGQVNPIRMLVPERDAGTDAQLATDAAPPNEAGSDAVGSDVQMDRMDTDVAPDVAPKPTCTASSIKDFGVGGEMALVATGEGYALAFAIGTGQGDAAPYDSRLHLLDSGGQTWKNVTLGRGAYPQLGYGEHGNLTVYQLDNASGQMAISQVYADGSGFHQNRSVQGPTFLSPVFAPVAKDQARLAWINALTGGMGCTMIYTGGIKTDGTVDDGVLVTSPVLRDGKCLNVGSYLMAFAASDTVDVIAVHQTTNEKVEKLSLLIGRAGHDEVLMDQWSDEKSFSFVEQIRRLPQGGFVVPVQHRTMENTPHGSEAIYSRTRLVFIDANGTLAGTIEIPHFVDFDTDGTRLATVSWNDDGTKSAFFHLTDMRGRPIQDLKLETVPSDFNARGKIATADGHTFLTVWGGGLTAADSLSPVHAARILCD